MFKNKIFQDAQVQMWGNKKDSGYFQRKRIKNIFVGDLGWKLFNFPEMGLFQENNF